MPQSFASLHCHLVFSTKHRQPFISDAIRPHLFKYLGGIAGNHSAPLIAAGGVRDHVHLLVSLPRTASIADLLRAMKANSSRWIHEEYPNLADFRWPEGYGAFAVSYSNLDAVKVYLASQLEHHRKQSFQDEFRLLLTRHDLEWDERYVWD